MKENPFCTLSFGNELYGWNKEGQSWHRNPSLLLLPLQILSWASSPIPGQNDNEEEVNITIELTVFQANASKATE